MSSIDDFTKKQESGSFGTPKPSIPVRPSRDPGTTYLFVTSMVIMILLALISITKLTYYQDYALSVGLAIENGYSAEIISGLQRLTSSTLLSLIALLINLIIFIIVFVFSTQARNIYKEAGARISKANTIFILSIVALLTSVFHFVTEIIASGDFTKLVKADPDLFKDVTNISDGMILYICVFIGLTIPLLIKSLNLKKLLINQAAAAKEAAAAQILMEQSEVSE